MEQFEDLGIPCLALDLESMTRLRKPLAKARLAKWLTLHSVACIHAQHFCVFSDVHRPGKWARANFQIVTEHTPQLFDKSSARVIRSFGQNASSIVAINRSVQTAISTVSGIRGDDIVIIENGIDTNRFAPSTKTQKDYCELVWVGRLHPDKDVLNGLRAFRHALTYSSKLRLTVVGDGQERAKAWAFVQQHELQNNVTFCGEVKDPVSALQQADGFLLSSATEGTPLALLEALSCGLPIVSTAVGGIPDVISDEVGILAPPNNPNALARGIVQIADNPDLRLQMGVRARALAERRFSELRMASAYTDLVMHLTRQANAIG